MLVLSPARSALVMLNACIEAALALSLFLYLRRSVGVYEHRVMPELLTALLMLWAAMAYGWFLNRPQVSRALLFALFACLAILTKPNRMALALLPPIAVIASRRPVLLKSPGFWLPAPLALACAPWYVFALPLMQNGWAAPTSATAVRLSIPPLTSAPS
jgi:hypothetical protein